MSKIEEAYELAVVGKRPEGAPEGIYEGLSEEEQADAVRNAMMVAHVAACGRVCSELDRLDALCGDGWLCEDAREIEELGR